MKNLGLLVFILAIAAGSAAGQGTLDFNGQEPEEGKPMTVSLTGAEAAGASLAVLYRPNSATEKYDEAGPFVLDEAGRVEWTPRFPGIATLTVTDSQAQVLAAKDVAIRFSAVPVAGITVMILAGILLFGGAGYSLVLALRQQ